MKKSHRDYIKQAEELRNQIETTGFDKYNVVTIVKSVVNFLESARNVHIDFEDFAEMRQYLDYILESE